MTTLVDVTDLVEFMQRRESVSGIQRVIAEVVPLLVDRDPEVIRPVILDRGRGLFVELSADEMTSILVFGARASHHSDRGVLAEKATEIIERSKAAIAVNIDDDTVLLLLGALWVSDALMMATRHAHSRGAKIVCLLYDVTPILDAGHTMGVQALFRQYLHLLAQTASRVPAISRNSRRDFETWLSSHGYTGIPGEATGLPPGVTPKTVSPARLAEVGSPWPRPYALMVGTIEARKNHLLAFRAWERLVDERGPESIPDLVCIGRLGWNSSEFLDAMHTTQGLGGKVNLLTASTSDADLVRFYSHAEFTLYPSRYEGWGLPVSESLGFGIVPVVADNSSLREAGGDLALYFRTDDADSLVDVLRHEILDAQRLQEHRSRIVSSDHVEVSWEHVADTVAREVSLAKAERGREVMYPEIELGREYVLSRPSPRPDGGFADRYSRYLETELLTPMLRQSRFDDDSVIVHGAVCGEFGSPQSWGYELRPGCRAEFRVRRPVDGPLTLLIATRSMPGRIMIEAVGVGGSVRREIYLGSVIVLPLGDGVEGEPALTSLAVVDASDSIEGFLGIRSFVVLRSDDKDAEVIALRSSADALRQELDYLQSTRSWRLTAPLRRWKGRASS